MRHETEILRLEANEMKKDRGRAQYRGPSHSPLFFLFTPHFLLEETRAVRNWGPRYVQLTATFLVGYALYCTEPSEIRRLTASPTEYLPLAKACKPYCLFTDFGIQHLLYFRTLELQSTFNPSTQCCIR